MTTVGLVGAGDRQGSGPARADAALAAWALTVSDATGMATMLNAAMNVVMFLRRESTILSPSVLLVALD
jgi:hypothetical protein